MANPRPTNRGRKPGVLNKSTIERELKVRAVMQHMIEAGHAKADDFAPRDSLAWMEAMARNSALDMHERREFAKAVAPYIYPRKQSIQIDPREEEHDLAEMTVDELEALQKQAANILIEHDPEEPAEGE